MAGEDTVPAPAPAPMDQQVEQPALVLVGGGNPDPLHNFSDIQQAVNDMAKENPDNVPMAAMLGLMAKELRFLLLIYNFWICAHISCSKCSVGLLMVTL